jgi:hypothetical protein
MELENEKFGCDGESREKRRFGLWEAQEGTWMLLFVVVVVVAEKRMMKILTNYRGYNRDS